MSAATNPEFKIGDRCSWTNAPDWWNPTGEKILAIEGDTALLDYWGVAIPISNLILISCAPKPESSSANKLTEFPKSGVASLNEEAAA